MLSHFIHTQTHISIFSRGVVDFNIEGAPNLIAKQYLTAEMLLSDFRSIYIIDPVRVIVLLLQNIDVCIKYAKLNTKKTLD